MLYNKLSNKKGFTLIELLIVIVIVGVLASIAIPNLTGIVEEARIEAVTFNTRTLLTEIEAYRFKEGNYPEIDSNSTQPTKDFIDTYSSEFNALNGIVQELGTDDYDQYHYESNGNQFVFSLQLPNGDYVGISEDEGLERGLDGHLSLSE